jgi:hypothetical protein
MQQNKNSCVRMWVYRTCDPKVMLKVQPKAKEEVRSLKLDFNKHFMVNPKLQPRPNFVVVS